MAYCPSAPTTPSNSPPPFLLPEREEESHRKLTALASCTLAPFARANAVDTRLQAPDEVDHGDCSRNDGLKHLQDRRDELQQQQQQQEGEGRLHLVAYAANQSCQIVDYSRPMFLTGFTSGQIVPPEPWRSPANHATSVPLSSDLWSLELWPSQSKSLPTHLPTPGSMVSRQVR
ncbi:hypothetical protein VTK73DRAFT_9921 [Phialemonium thermophilum]|uniref:Uncharacterized protein n=1 Tax=Phialemonium thermophilum TaxID=223376 RepID=A0ABR3VZL5_9PEZI